MKKVIMLLAILAFSNIGIAKAQSVVVEDGKTVKIDYTLTVDGKMVDTSEGKQPLEYVQGNKMIIPGLEKELEGLKVGDEKTVVVKPEDAYGVVDPKAVVEIPKANLTSDDVTPEVGMFLQLTGSDGKAYSGLVKEIKDESLVIDFNHPLAGKKLTFKVKIVDVK